MKRILATREKLSLRNACRADELKSKMFPCPPLQYWGLRRPGCSPYSYSSLTTAATPSFEPARLRPSPSELPRRDARLNDQSIRLPAYGASAFQDRPYTRERTDRPIPSWKPHGTALCSLDRQAFLERQLVHHYLVGLLMPQSP